MAVWLLGNHLQTAVETRISAGCVAGKMQIVIAAVAYFQELLEGGSRRLPCPAWKANLIRLDGLA